MKTKILLQLFRPYLTPMEADEIRAEAFALKPQIALVMADWPWIEIRGLKPPDAKKFLEMLAARRVKFREMAMAKKTTRAQVQTSETMEAT